MHKLSVLLILFFIATIFVFVAQPLGETNFLLEQGLYTFAAISATVSGFLALQAYGRGSRFSSLLLLSLGLLFWLFADATFIYLDFFLHSLDFPSIADYSYLAGYSLLFLGVMLELRSVDIRWKKLNKRVLVAVSSFTLLMLGIFTYLTLTSSYKSDAPLGQNIVTIGYTVGDLLLVIGSFFAIVMAWEYRGGRASIVWGMLFLGFLATMTADFIYAVYPDEFAKHAGFIYSLSQYFYIGGYLLIVYALISLRSTLHTFRRMLQEAWEREK